MTNQEHNKLLAIFFYIYGGLQILTGLLLALVYVGMGTFFAVAGGEPEAAAIGGVVIIVAVIVLAIMTVFAGFYLYTARSIQKAAPIGRILGIIASVLCLFSIPLGTALGIYGLWFLVGDDGKRFYSDAGEYSPAPPPPPNSWQ